LAAYPGRDDLPQPDNKPTLATATAFSPIAARNGDCTETTRFVTERHPEPWR